ncbi:RHS repeat-associated core domain-containing protein, partial [Proteus mirabilis]
SSAAPHTTVYHAYNDQSYTPLARIECTDNPLNPQRAIYYTHSSLSGLPEALTNSEGEIVWQGQYSAWGHLQRQTRPTSTFNREQNLRFQGQYFDKETGLHYNTFRYYAPDLGRFTQQDPIGLAGGINLYAYAPNPLTWVDPWGWSCIKSFNKKNNITNRWVNILSGKHPNQVHQFLLKKGYIQSIHRTSPNATPHIRYTGINKSGNIDILDYHPGGNNAVHRSDYWKVYRDGEVQGRIGYGKFTNYDRIFDSPVYVDGILVNSPDRKLL